jgi:hypothetical protein
VEALSPESHALNSRVVLTLEVPVSRYFPRHMRASPDSILVANGQITDNNSSASDYTPDTAVLARAAVPGPALAKTSGRQNSVEAA